MNNIENVSINNLSSGIVSELFDRELEKIVENISDINTPPMAKREITIKIAIKPNLQRDNGEVSVKVHSKLAPAVEYKEPIYFSNKQAFQSKKPQNITLFDTAIKSITVKG